MAVQCNSMTGYPMSVDMALGLKLAESGGMQASIAAQLIPALAAGILTGLRSQIKEG